MLRALAATMTLFFSTASNAASFHNFENFQSKQSCYPEKVFEPKTIEEVQDIIGLAHKNKKRVMTANKKFKSLIDAACADRGHYQLTLNYFNKISKIDKAKRLVTIQAGMIFRNAMDVLAEDGLTINMVNGFSDVSIGGMLGSGTHGSTLAKGQYAFIGDYLHSLTVVDGRGRIRNVSGSDLKSFGVNLGVLGVVIDATFKVQPLIKVQAEQKSLNDNNLESEILNLARSRNSISINWFPGIKRYSYSAYSPISLDATGDAINTQLEIPKIGLSLFDWLFQLSHNKKHVACATSRLRDFSTKIPFFKEDGKYKKNAVGFSHKMQYFSCTEGNCLWEKAPMNLQALAIPLEKLPEWIIDVKTILRKSPACFPANGIFMRFSPASDNYLSLAYGRETVILDIEFIMNKKEGAAPRFYDVHQEIEQLTLQKYKARAHWGKNREAAFANLDQRYEKWDEFLRTKKKYDPKNIFINTFWQRISKDTYQFPGCALYSRCFCQSDADCYEGLQCEIAPVYTNARVCR